jgi:hypothetical protein
VLKAEKKRVVYLSILTATILTSGLSGSAGAEIFLVVFHVLRSFLATTALLTTTMLSGLLTALLAATISTLTLSGSAW